MIKETALIETTTRGLIMSTDGKHDLAATNTHRITDTGQMGESCVTKMLLEHSRNGSKRREKIFWLLLPALLLFYLIVRVGCVLVAESLSSYQTSTSREERGAPPLSRSTMAVPTFLIALALVGIVDAGTSDTMYNYYIVQ